MKTRSNALIVWLALFPWFLFGGRGNAQETNLRAESVTYKQVLDSAFQFSTGIPSEFRGLTRRIVVRHSGTAAAEWQDVYLERSDGSVRIIQFRIKDGTQSISKRYEEVLRRSSTASTKEILNSVDIEKVEKAGSPSVTQRLVQFSRLTVPVELNTDLCADGAKYDLWIQTLSNEIHASFSDCAYGEATDSAPIISWLKSATSHPPIP